LRSLSLNSQRLGVIVRAAAQCLRQLQLKRHFFERADRIVKEREQRTAPFASAAFSDVRAHGHGRATQLLHQAEALVGRECRCESVYRDGQLPRFAIDE
jgi:hypothetical protein